MNPILLIAAQPSADHFPFLTLFWTFVTLSFITFLWWMTPEQKWQAVVSRLSKFPAGDQDPTQTADPFTRSNAGSSPETPADSAGHEGSEATTEKSLPVDDGTSSESDDLTRLKSVTPKMAAMMNREGIHRFEQLRSMDVPQRKELASKLGVFTLPWSDWELFWDSHS